LPQSAFHQTSSAVLVLPRSDGKFLIPAIAFDETHPSLDLEFIALDILPKTEDGYRRWGVWCRKSPLPQIWNNDTVYTPDRAVGFQLKVNKARRIYRNLLDGNQGDAVGLEEVFTGIVAGGWFKYYTQTLPNFIRQNAEEVERVVNSVFDGFESRVEMANAVYSGLSDVDKLLLRNAFNFTIQVKPSEPAYYLEDEAHLMFKPGFNRWNEQWRDPNELTVEPRGIGLGQVEAIYLPNEIRYTEVVKVASRKLVSMGFKNPLKNSLSLLAQG